VYPASTWTYTTVPGQVQIPWAIFTSEGGQNKEIDARNVKENEFLRRLYRSVATKRKLSNTAKLSGLKEYYPKYKRQKWDFCRVHGITKCAAVKFVKP